MSCKQITGGDNKYYSCPARMSDARAFTDYAPRCQANFEALKTPMTSYDYRMYLIHNAEKLMEDNKKAALKTNYCEPCVSPSTMLPEHHKQVCNSRTCSFPETDAAGLGVGRNYF